MDRARLLRLAADHIERFPSAYDFTQAEVRYDPHQPHCFLARMAQIEGSWVGMLANDFCLHTFRFYESEFFKRLTDAIMAMSGCDSTQISYDNPVSIVRGLRELAKSYDRDSPIPDETRAIFDAPRRFTPDQCSLLKFEGLVVQ